MSEGAQELLKELAGEAFDKTGGDVWKAGQPLVNDPAAQHAAQRAEQQPKTEEQPKEEGATPASERLIAGKWKTEQEAERGIHELVRYANSQKTENEQLRMKVDAITAALSAINGGPKPAEASSDPLDALESIAIPKEPIALAINAGVKRAFDDLLRPLAERQTADREILKMYPDYEKEFDQLMEFLEKNPEVKQEVQYAETQGQYLMARKYAWLHYDRLGRAEQQKNLAEKAKTRTERVKETLPDTGVGGGVRLEPKTPEPERGWPDGDRMKYLKDMAQAGHPDLLWRETLGELLRAQGFPGPSQP